MKKKIKVVDNVTGKTVEGEVTVPNDMHFQVQLHTKAAVFKNRKKYTRKKKHKNKEE